MNQVVVPAMETVATEVLSVREETPTVRFVRLRRPPDFAFQAVQAARLILQPGALAHPFSIASGPERPYLEFAARPAASDFKRTFFDLQPGKRSRSSAPRAASSWKEALQRCSSPRDRDRADDEHARARG